MVSVLALLLAPVAIPAGGYVMTDLCQVLTQATGQTHRVLSPLNDWAVYVRLADASPENVKAKVAIALRAEWREEKGVAFLRSGKNLAPTSEALFQKGWTKAIADQPEFSTIPIKKLYEMRVGDQILFSSTSEPESVAIPAGPDRKPKRILLRRLVGNTYERGQTQLNAKIDLTEALAALGDRANKGVEIPEEFRPSPRMGGSTLTKPDTKQPDENILVRQSAKLFDTIAKVATCDLVTPIPDGIWAAGFEFDGPQTVQTTLEALANFIDWEAQGDLVLGRITAADFGAATQVDRAKMHRVLMSPPPVFDTPLLARIEGEQPPLAGLASNLLITLGLTGIPIDGSPHFPYDVRLYRSFTNADWQVVRTPGATLADLSGPVQRAIRIMLLKSRMVFETSADVEGIRRSPAFQVPISLKESSADAIILRYGSAPPEMTDVLNLVGIRLWRLFEERLASYLVVTKRQLTLSIAGFEVPFIKIDMPAGAKYTSYSNLPEVLRKEIEAAEEARRRQDGEQQKALARTP